MTKVEPLGRTRLAIVFLRVDPCRAPAQNRAANQKGEFISVHENILCGNQFCHVRTMPKRHTTKYFQNFLGEGSKSRHHAFTNQAQQREEFVRQTNFRFHDFPVRAYAPSIMSPIVIAINGPAASGKGTLARKLAQRLSFAYLDTGTLYRAMAKLVLDEEKDPSNEMDASRAAKNLSAQLKPEDLQNPILRPIQSALPPRPSPSSPRPPRP